MHRFVSRNVADDAPESGRRLRLAIQKSGRLFDGAVEILDRCGLRLSRPREQLFARARNFPLDVLLARDDDIPGLVAQGSCDWGIVGGDVFAEFELQHSERDFSLVVVEELGFAYCSLALAVPLGCDMHCGRDLHKKRIATSYPAILEEHLRRENIEACVVTLSGSVEAAPRLGIADAICDLVSTGSALVANGLREIGKILESQALLIARGDSLSCGTQEAAKRLQLRIRSVCRARDAKYIALHAPRARLQEIVSLLPGAESPSILPLEGSDRVAVHVVCSEPVFWDTMERLRHAGASSILVLPIEKILQ